MESPFGGEINMHLLYQAAWERLRHDRLTCREIEREATPVLFFGRWQTAIVATAGLNPSEREFLDKPTAGKRSPALQGTRQRFIHWENGDLSESRLDEAFHRAEGYFNLGNAYGTWFDRYSEFLQALHAPFREGAAVHTDYVSPFATRMGVSKCGPTAIKMLLEFGLGLWVRVLAACPKVKVVVGQGQGWRYVLKQLDPSAHWVTIATPFDHKGGKQWAGKPHLVYALVRFGDDDRMLHVYWWKPNRDGSPMCYLTKDESRRLGELVRNHSGSNRAF